MQRLTLRSVKARNMCPGLYVRFPVRPYYLPDGFTSKDMHLWVRLDATTTYVNQTENKEVTTLYPTDHLTFLPRTYNSDDLVEFQSG